MVKALAVVLASLLLCNGCGGGDGPHTAGGALDTSGNTTTTPPVQPPGDGGGAPFPPGTEPSSTGAPTVLPDPRPEEHGLVRVDIAPTTNRLWVGTDRQLLAAGTYADGTMADLTLQINWRSSDTRVATVTRGMVFARAPGSAEITATMGSITGMALVSVPPLPVAP